MNIKMKKNKYLAAFIVFSLIVVGLYYKLHLVNVLMGFDELLFSGRFAKDVLAGIPESIWGYHIVDYQNTVVWMGFLAIPFIIIFGDVFFSLYCVHMFLTVMTLWVTYYLCRKHFDQFTAYVALFLSATMPYLLALESANNIGALHHAIYGVGGHHEVSLFALLALLFFFDIFYDERSKQSYFSNYQDEPQTNQSPMTAISKLVTKNLTIRFFLLGLFNAAGILIIYSNSVIVPIILFSWFYFDPKLFKRRFIYVYMSGLSIGLLPIVSSIIDAGEVMHLGSCGTSFDFSILSLFVQKDFESIFYTLSYLFNTILDYLMVPQWAEALFPRHILGYGLFCVLIMAFVRLIHLISSGKKARVSSLTQKESVVVAFIFTFCVLFILFPSIHPEPLYLIPIYPFLFILIGSFCSRLFRYKYKMIFARCASLSIVCTIIFFGIYNVYAIGVYSPIRFCELEDMFRLKGFNSNRMPQGIVHPMGRSFMFHDYHEAVSFSQFNLDAPYVDLHSKYPEKYTIIKEYESLETYPSDLRQSMFKILGMVAMDGMDDARIETFYSLLTQSLQYKYQQFFLEGTALSYGLRFFSEVEKGMSSGMIQRAVPQQFLHYYYIQLGKRVALHFKDDEEESIDYFMRLLVAEADQGQAPYLLYGLLNALKTFDEVKAVELQINDMSLELKRMYYFWKGSVTYFNEIHRTYPSDNLANYCPARFRTDFIMGAAASFLPFEIDKNSMTIIDLENTQSYDHTKSPFLSESDITAFYMGIGFKTALVNCDKKRELQVAAIDSPYRIPFLEGYGLGMAFKYGNDQKTLKYYSADIVPVEYKRALEYGSKRLETWIGVNPTVCISTGENE